jgi:hypothetical protein
MSDKLHSKFYEKIIIKIKALQTIIFGRQEYRKILSKM